MENILFLGIEGVLDNGWHKTIYNHPNRRCWEGDQPLFSYEDQGVDICAARVLLQLCQDTNCKLVFITTYKFPLYSSTLGPGFFKLLENEGLSSYFHSTWITDYPDEPSKIKSCENFILHNCKKNSRWALLDHEDISHPCAFQVPYWPGLSMCAYRHCLKCFGMYAFNSLDPNEVLGRIENGPDPDDNIPKVDIKGSTGEL